MSQNLSKDHRLPARVQCSAEARHSLYRHTAPPSLVVCAKFRRLNRNLTMIAMSSSLLDQPAPRRNRLGWWIAVSWSLAWLAGLSVVMAGLHIDRSPTAEAGAANLRGLWAYWITCAGLWTGLTAIWLMLMRGPRGSESDGRRFWRTAAFVFMLALGARVAVLITHRESLSDDVYRYIFDGRNLAAGHNPYLEKAADRIKAGDERWPGEKQLLPLITFPELATPYLPVTQWVFGALGLMIDHRWTDPASSARTFRVGFVAIELAMLLLVFATLRHGGCSAWWAVLYAWHPLPISEIAGSGHQDIIGITCLVAALLAFSVVPTKTGCWSGLLAMSALGKPFTLPAGPIMLRGRPMREWFVSTAAGSAVMLLAIAPFWVIRGGHGVAFHNWKATVDMLAEKFAHFGGVYEPILWVVRRAMPAAGHPAGFNLKQEWLARHICLGILVLIALAIFFNRRLNVWQATRAMLFAMVLLTTTAHPWYLLWAFALIPMANSWAIWILSLTLPWGYAVFTTLGRADWPWIPSWLYWAAYAPVFAALVCDGVIHWRSRASNTSSPTYSAEIGIT
jgi:alpha-1,6-mannosyltransferase